jgi:hypothetical protein
VSVSEDKPSTESSAASSDQAVNESVAMLSNYFDLAQENISPIRSGDDEPIPSMFRVKQNSYREHFPKRPGSSKGIASTVLLIVIGSFLFLATGGAVLSFLVFSSDKSVVEPASAPEYPQRITTEASSSPAGSGVVEAPQALPVAPTQQLENEGEPWSDAMQTYK